MDNAEPNTAKHGYRKLPGTGANQIGHAKYGDAPTGLMPSKSERTTMGPFPTMSTKPQPEPLQPPDLKMSIKHHKDRIKQDRDHVEDHARGVIAASHRGDQTGLEYHARHMQDHAFDIRHRTEGLKQRQKQLKGKKSK